MEDRGPCNGSGGELENGNKSGFMILSHFYAYFKHKCKVSMKKEIALIVILHEYILPHA